MNSTETKKLTVAFKYWALGKAEYDPSWYDVITALNVAQKYHDGQRKDGKPEFSHQINIVSFLRSLSPLMIDPVSVIVTALLHDTYEDYETSQSEIKELLPEYFNYIVRVSKVRDGEKITYEQYFKEMSNCHVTSIVKGVDRIHNISTMGSVFSNEKKIQYADFEICKWFHPMIKTARNLFPEQEGVYEIIKSTLNIEKEIVLSNTI